jgi:outer membrane protein
MLKKRLILFGLLAAAAHGQPSATLDGCVKAALENDPGLCAAKAESDAATEDARQAFASFFPSLDASGSVKRQSMVPTLEIAPVQLPFGGTYSPFPGGGMSLGLRDSYDFHMTLSQPVFTGFRLIYRKKMADAAKTAKRMEEARIRNELVQKVETAYGNVLKAQKFLEISRTGRDQVAAHLADVGHFFDQGLVKKDELLKVKVRMTDAELSVVQAENGVALATAVLESLTGRKFPADVRFEGVQPVDVPEADVSASVERALSARPELRAARYARRAADAGKGLARGGLFPAVSAFGSLGYGKPGLDIIGKKWMDYWIVGVGAEWNLWSWGKTRSQMRQAASKSAEWAETERQIREAVTLEVTQACLRLDEAKKRLGLTAEMESQAGESFRVAENLYKEGQSSHTEFFDAQSECTRARLARAQAEVDLLIAQSAWRKAVGSGDAGPQKNDIPLQP